MLPGSLRSLGDPTRVSSLDPDLGELPNATARLHEFRHILFEHRPALDLSGGSLGIMCRLGGLALPSIKLQG